MYASNLPMLETGGDYRSSKAPGVSDGRGISGRDGGKTVVNNSQPQTNQQVNHTVINNYYSNNYKHQ